MIKISHWYSSDAVLHDRVPNASKSGELRDATLADARKYGWGPSVTTVQQILAKPGLSDWQMDQTIDAVLRTPQVGDEQAWRLQVKARANEVRDTAADFGTQVHRAIDQLAKGAGQSLALDVGVAAYKIASEALKVLTGAGLVIEQGERGFYNAEYDYGGTIDIVGSWQGRPCFADVKTQVGRMNFYPEYPVQLAGYACGVGQPERDRVSIIVSRETPGLVEVRNWSTYMSKNGNGWPNERADAAWFAVLRTWELLNNWSAK